ncbi:MAG: carboxypeptidase-like regulatory domain-containing protein [Burkholderiaceae bacterium]
MLLLQVRLDDHLLSDSLSAYAEGRRILLPLGALSRLLTIGITVHPESRSASGFVLRQDNGFALNVDTGRVSRAGREMPLDARRVRVIDDDIYVSSELLALWLPIDLQVDLPTLKLRVKPRQRLPLQERLAREAVGARLRAGAPEGTAPRFARVDAPVAMVGVPFIDQTLGGEALLANGTTQYKTSYTAYVTGDLLGLEGAAYVTSSRDKPDPTLRLTLGRHDPDAGLLGPLQARSFMLGNIVAPSVPNLVAGSPPGVGLSISNRPLDRSTTFDRQTLRGNLPPGWDLTLYYNDALIGYQASRADGQYSFDDLPLTFGPNEFRLVFNGPLGQVRVERQSFLLDRSIVRPGELFYSLAHLDADAGGARSIAQVEFGLTSELSANAGLLRASRTGSRQERSYTQLGLRGYLDSMVLSSQFSLAHAGGVLADLALKTRWGGFAIDLQHLQRLGDFDSEIFPSESTTLRYRDSFRLNGSLKPPALPPLSFAILAQRDVTDSGASNVALETRVSTMVADTSVSNNLRWQRLTDWITATGSGQLSRRVLDVGLNARVDYRVRPDVELQSLALAADRTLTEGYRANLGVMREMMSQTTWVSAGLAKSLGRFGVSINASHSTRNEAAVSVQLFMAIGCEPRTGNWFADAQPMAATGAVAARAFVDRNLNGIHEPGEEFIPNVGFLLNGGGRPAGRTDTSGMALITRLPPGKYTDMTLDPHTLEDPKWRPSKRGVRVLPRPGLVQAIEFPVVLTTEIDGTVYVTAKGTRRGIGDARVELMDENGTVVGSAISSPDGYYLLQQVVPGRYRLRIAPGQAATLNLGGPLERPLTVPADGEFIVQDFDLLLASR